MIRLRKLVESIKAFTPEQTEHILSFFSPVSLKKHTHLLLAEEICDNNSYVLNGCLRVYTTNETQKESTLYFAFEDWWIGDLDSFINQIPSKENIQALEDCSLAVISRKDYMYLMETYSVFKDIHLQKITKSYAAMTQKLSNDRLQPVEQRYKDLIEKHQNIIQRVPQHYIAQYLGIEPPSLSRIRKKISGK